MNEHDKDFEGEEGEELRRMLEDLIEKFERGEVQSAALRLFRTDGTHEDFALGDTELEKAQALTALRRRLGQLQ